MKTRSDSAQVCATESPEATETAPKPTPYAPVATPTPRLSRMIADRSRGSSGSSVTRERLVLRLSAGVPGPDGPVVEVVEQHVVEQQAGEAAPADAGDDQATGRSTSWASQTPDSDADDERGDDHEDAVELRQRTEHELTPDLEWTPS